MNHIPISAENNLYQPINYSLFLTTERPSFEGEIYIDDADLGLCSADFFIAPYILKTSEGQFPSVCLAYAMADSYASTSDPTGFIMSRMQKLDQWALIANAGSTADKLLPIHNKDKTEFDLLEGEFPPYLPDVVPVLEHYLGMWVSTNLADLGEKLRYEKKPAATAFGRMLKNVSLHLKGERIFFGVPDDLAQIADDAIGEASGETIGFSSHGAIFRDVPELKEYL